MITDRYVTTGVIRKGKLKIPNVARWMETMRQLPDGPVVLSLRRARATRSLEANAYYWGVVIKAISEHTGYTPDETHQALKMLFLPKHLAYADGNGEVVKDLVIGGSTAQLSRGEFNAYVQSIRAWALQTLDVDIA